MQLSDIKERINSDCYTVLENDGIKDMRPSQEKAINAGLLDYKNVLVCTPTASGKTLIAELAMLKHITEGKGKALYIVPLKALASEKYNHFKKRYGHLTRVSISVGDLDSGDSYLANADLIVCTAEKFDSLLRHNVPWVRQLSCMVIDEIHLLNDPSRGPTLEIIMTIMKKLNQHIHLIGLSATMGNPDQLSSWMDANLVEDFWRPVELKHGVYYDGEIDFVKESK